MSEVGGYDLHLYCQYHYDDADAPGHENDVDISHSFPHQFEGTHRTDALAQARRRGWRKKKGMWYCPSCTGIKPPPPDPRLKTIQQIKEASE